METFRKGLFTAALAAGLCGMLAGCVQSRVVMTPHSHDLLAQAPDWARTNGKIDPDGKLLYFVGISQEQTLGEAEAVDAAYKDALRRASDYLGVIVAGIDTTRTDTTQTSWTAWPYRVTPHLNMWLGGAVGVGGFAESRGSDRGAVIGGALLPFWKEDPEFKRSTRQAHYNLRQSDFDRYQWVAHGHIVDTWTVAERFFAGRKPGQTTGHQNDMRYGEVWKAKVLVAVPKATMKDRAEGILDMYRTEYEIERDFRVREAEMQFDRPTFHFMNATYLYGQGFPRTYVRQMPRP